MRGIGWFVFAVGLTAVACAGAPTSVESTTTETGSHDGHDMAQGSISFSGQGRTFKTTALGGLVGADSVNGIKVGVYVLQAESPERLKPTGSGPTHLFNLTFMDEKSEELLRDASGTVTVTGAEGIRRQETFAPFESHFQARIRLDRPGDYTVRVDFETEVGSGATGQLPFPYRWKDSGHNH